MFTVYSKPGCSYCKKVTRLLELAETRYVVYSMGRDFSPSEFYEKFGEGSSFPQVIFNETKIGGCSATLNYLKENEYL
tara:strand:- start:563 stop:796 length:234 start_codon:yes stop_codon:yes gene_type:complete